MTITELIETLESAKRRYGDEVNLASLATEDMGTITPLSKAFILSEEESSEEMEWYGAQEPTVVIW